MNKIISISILLVFNSIILLSQDLRDDYIGTYYCKVSNCHLNQLGQYDCNPATSKITISKPQDLLQIKVTFDDNSEVLLTKENDSTYSSSGLPYISALFFSKDSIKLSRVYSSVGYSMYYGKKDTNTEIKDINGIDFKFYPNPFNSQITIDNLNCEEYNLKLTDLTGRSVLEKMIKFQNSTLIQTTELRRGIYILQIIYNNSSNSYKVMKN